MIAKTQKVFEFLLIVWNNVFCQVISAQDMKPVLNGFLLWKQGRALITESSFKTGFFAFQTSFCLRLNTLGKT